MEKYLSLFETRKEAVDFENLVLSVGSEFLPDCAKNVLDGLDATKEYWDFLIDQNWKALIKDSFGIELD